MLTFNLLYVVGLDFEEKKIGCEVYIVDWARLLVRSTFFIYFYVTE